MDVGGRYGPDCKTGYTGFESRRRLHYSEHEDAAGRGDVDGVVRPS